VEERFHPAAPLDKLTEGSATWTFQVGSPLGETRDSFVKVGEGRCTLTWISDERADFRRRGATVREYLYGRANAPEQGFHVGLGSRKLWSERELGQWRAPRRRCEEILHLGRQMDSAVHHGGGYRLPRAHGFVRRPSVFNDRYPDFLGS